MYFGIVCRHYRLNFVIIISLFMYRIISLHYFKFHSMWYNANIFMQTYILCLLLGAIHLWRPQKSGFWPPPLSTYVHMGRTPSPLWTSTHRQHEIHTALLKRLVQWPTGPKADVLHHHHHHHHHHQHHHHHHHHHQIFVYLWVVPK